MDTVTDWLPGLLQNSDSLFPTGSYAHSSGLEEVVRFGMVVDESSLQSFLREQVVPSLQNLELPYVRYAYDAGVRVDLASLEQLSDEISAWKLGREAREASWQIGRGRLQTARKVFPLPQLEELASSHIALHYITVFGWQMALSRVPVEAALTAFLYQALAGFCSASLKLIRIGPEGAQRVLKQSLADADFVVAASQRIEREDAGWFNPILEVAGMRHERADERLFIS